MGTDVAHGAPFLFDCVCELGRARRSAHPKKQKLSRSIADLAEILF